MQSLFSPFPPMNILPFGGEAILYENLFSNEESDTIYEHLVTTIRWKQEPIKMFGKMVMQPRLTACYGERSVAYSGITMEVQHWTEELLAIKGRVEEKAKMLFNSVLLNYYRDGNDSMGWHRDNERELGAQPVIASVSFGATRKFQLRTYKDKSDLVSVGLTPGSLLLMQGESQQVWEHSLPKTKHAGGRVNLTFRSIV
ncbi:alpha-ketoglutarate-dependent dioxygenase AlkB [Flavipsychrobacter stenotrophus]|uniref:Alpha-ketoglutarate-dependent dioxygenase AlkB n=1 Tax=Flavipsychrobacter stenotrophus TaxID=2077091 RepID=A0A2S7ST16_9BACT|nr:alpha-ketoglutarate-dependent dioxygenase AlkB [Flavipsychrobacter stenotrophus]PQJ10063.1 alpha-ketoglutarate-dependent dioxygenase AlkB [Flavipsychrobacter stenotrophus]